MTISAGSSATVSVTASGSNTSKVFSFFFGIPKGDKGDKGDQGNPGTNGTNGTNGQDGAAAGFGTPTASVDSNVGTPSVSVTASGPNTAKVFNFEFHNLKGAKGDQGNPGASGTVLYRHSLEFEGPVTGYYTLLSPKSTALTLSELATLTGTYFVFVDEDTFAVCFGQASASKIDFFDASGSSIGSAISFNDNVYPL